MLSLDPSELLREFRDARCLARVELVQPARQPPNVSAHSERQPSISGVALAAAYLAFGAARCELENVANADAHNERPGGCGMHERHGLPG